MKRFLIATAAMALLAGTTTAFAADRHDNHGPAMKGPAMQGHAMQGHAPGFRSHPEWRKGARMNKNDWGRGQRVDYRSRHLNAPPRGYEWREVDGNYVLGAVATGLIASIILANQ